MEKVPHHSLWLWKPLIHVGSCTKVSETPQDICRDITDNGGMGGCIKGALDCGDSMCVYIYLWKSHTTIFGNHA